MKLLTKMYHPITGTPFQQDETYMEVPPCDALKPYIRCFWGTQHPVRPKDITPCTGLVIPDTCMDVIFDVNYTRNTCFSIFCGLDDTSEITHGQTTMDETATFGIRFYAWTAVLFADGDMRSTRNARADAASFSKAIKTALMQIIFDAGTMEDRIIKAETVLLKILKEDKQKMDVLNAVYRILETNGRIKVQELSGYTGASFRKLEREFDSVMGLSPKMFSSLVRYQMLWQEMIGSNRFDVLDAVEKYGYTDQAHLLHDFKKRHLMTPSEAVLFAKEHG